MVFLYMYVQMYSSMVHTYWCVCLGVLGPPWGRTERSESTFKDLVLHSGPGQAAGLQLLADEVLAATTIYCCCYECCQVQCSTTTCYCCCTRTSSIYLCGGTLTELRGERSFDSPAQGNPYNTLPPLNGGIFGASEPYTSVR